MESPTFWNDQEKAKAIIQELKALNSVLKPFEELVKQADNLAASIELAEEAETDEFDDEIRAAVASGPRLTSRRSSCGRCWAGPTTTATPS